MMDTRLHLRPAMRPKLFLDLEPEEYKLTVIENIVNEEMNAIVGKLQVIFSVE